jgi:hypothetical protein
MSVISSIVREIVSITFALLSQAADYRMMISIRQVTTITRRLAP